LRLKAVPAMPGTVKVNMANEKDRVIVRDLAKRVAEIAALPIQAQRAALWTACNDLKPKRAMVVATQQPPDELDAAWLKMECQDPLYRGFESALRHVIMHHEHIPDDFPVLREFKVGIPASGDSYDDYGIHLETTSSDPKRGAYHIEPMIKSEADIDRLHFRPVKIHHDRADQRVAQAKEIFGDILPARKVGRIGWRFGLTRVLIHMRGLDQMMLDFYDNPALIHRLMKFLQDDLMREVDLYERENAISLNNMPDTYTGSGGLCPTKDLPGEDFDGVVKPKHCVAWEESQETVGVGPAQFDEFVLQYQLPFARRFGLVDYGCCEPLDYKLDLLMAKIPNLRWVAVTPWANRQVCAEKIGKKYVYVYKPNPSRICSPKPDWAGAEKEIRETLQIARGCAVHICMKDTKTLCNEPERTTRWCEMAVRIAKEMA